MLELLFLLQFHLLKEVILIDSLMRAENTLMRFLLLQHATQKYSVNIHKLIPAVVLGTFSEKENFKIVLSLSLVKYNLDY